MKYLSLILLLCIITFAGCDGRDRIHKSPEEILVENKLLDSFSEHVKYIPESYAETETDTILSNGFRVKIKSYLDMDSSVLKKYKVATITHLEYHRTLINDIKVYKNDKLIFSQNLTNDFLNTLNNKYALGNEYLSNVAVVDELTTLTTNEVNIIISQCIPRSVNCPDFYLTIDTNGDYNLKEINNNART